MIVDQIRLFQDSVASLDIARATDIFEEALKETSPMSAVESIVVPALENIGDEWEKGTIALSQIYLSGRICEEIVDRALPPSNPDRKNQPHSAIAVLNDYHMLGKRIVYSVMRASGYEVFDYGRLEAEELVARALADNIKVLMISVLMLPSALKVKEVRKSFEEAGANVKIIVGGAPFLFDSELWREVGADAMGKNASDAVRIVESWMVDINE